MTSTDGATVTKTVTELEADYRRISARADEATEDRASAKTAFDEAKTVMRAALSAYNNALAVETGLRKEQEALALRVAEARARRAPEVPSSAPVAAASNGDKRNRRGAR